MRIEGDRPEGADGIQGRRQVEDVFLDAEVGSHALAVAGHLLSVDAPEGLGCRACIEETGLVWFNDGGLVEAVPNILDTGAGGDYPELLRVVVDGESTVRLHVYLGIGYVHDGEADKACPYAESCCLFHGFGL